MPAANSLENGLHRVGRDAERAADEEHERGDDADRAERGPSSSPIAANTKSVAAFGMRFGLPRPSPVPADAARAERVLRLD